MRVRDAFLSSILISITVSQEPPLFPLRNTPGLDDDVDAELRALPPDLDVNAPYNLHLIAHMMLV